MSKTQENTSPDQERFLNNADPKQRPRPPLIKRTLLDRFFYTVSEPVKSVGDEVLDLNDAERATATMAPVASLDLEAERLQWDSISEYVLSIIGFVIDLGNVWRWVRELVFIFEFFLTSALKNYRTLPKTPIQKGE